jgi:hypothetical protein
VVITGGRRARLASGIDRIGRKHGNVCKSPADIVLEQRLFFTGLSHLCFSKIRKRNSRRNNRRAVSKSPAKPSGLSFVLRDFSSTGSRQKQIEFLSFHDHLTVLPQPAVFGAGSWEYGHARESASDGDDAEVNGLKLTNMPSFHTMGDCCCVQSPISKIRPQSRDLIARVGGDEFSILLPRPTRPKAKKIKQRILQEAMNTKSIRCCFAGNRLCVKKSVTESIENVLRKR